jgi:manganese efflux pump family protein
VPAILSLLLVSVSVGLSNFAGAIGIGLSGIDGRTRLRVGIAFGLFEAVMPLIGLLIGGAISDFISGPVERDVAGGVLVLTGAYTIWQGWGTEKKQGPNVLGTQHLLVTAAALSIDNLAVGFALAVYHLPIVVVAVTMGVVSVAMSLVGLELGHHLGKRIEAWSEELGGAVLILVGIAIAVGVLG